MVCMMDMGTTNTRLWLYDGERWLGEERGAFGAMFGKVKGREALLKETRVLLERLISACGVSENAVDALIVSGMAGSEMGIYEIPHVKMPMDPAGLAKEIRSVRVEELGEMPVLFVPGVKWEVDGTIRDLMRGEEAELAGILPHIFQGEPLTVVLPGTHCKIVRVNAQGEISGIYTTMSGELLDLVVKNSILAGQVAHGAPLSVSDLMEGREYAEMQGVSAALFAVRVMEKNGIPADRRSSFLYGAILGQDVRLLDRMAMSERIFIGGKESLCRIYGALLGERAVELPVEIAKNATRNGLCLLYEQYRA